MDEKNFPNQDFDELNDRLIADKPKAPFIGIKTNLDEEDLEKYNPYNQKNHSFFER